MANSSSRERRLWFAAGLCLFLIYASLYSARPVAEYLRDRNLLRLSVALIFVVAAALVLWRILVSRPPKRVLVTLAFVTVGYAVILLGIPMFPEERLHFLEYGLFAGLVYAALLERRKRGATTLVSPFLGALILTLIAGWVDEGIQAVLPNRYYDLRDVAFNAGAGLACLVSIRLLQRARANE